MMQRTAKVPNDHTCSVHQSQISGRGLDLGPWACYYSRRSVDQLEEL